MKRIVYRQVATLPLLLVAICLQWINPAATQEEPVRKSDLAGVNTDANWLAQANEPLALDEVVVNADGSRGYRTRKASTATKTDTDILDVPQSVQVVPAQVLKDQNVLRVGDAARNVSGIAPRPGYAGSTDLYTIRGFAVSANLKNGFRDDGFLAFSDVANVEQVEVLKGPASVLYGRVEPGGVVNYVTKQPLATDLFAPKLTFGSFGYARASIDLSGALTTNRAVSYRLNAAYETSDSFRDFGRSELYFISPVLRFEFSRDTSLTIETEHFNLNRTFDRAFLPEAAFLNIPVNRFLGEPGDLYRNNGFRGRATVEHRFSERWRLRSAFSAQVFDALRTNAQPRNLLNDGRTLRRRYTATDEGARNYSWQSEIEGRFSTGPIAHRVLLGLEVGRDDFDYIFRTQNDFPSIDIFNPVYGATVPTTFGSSDDVKQAVSVLGLYVQDQVDLAPTLKLLSGLRFDIADYTNSSGPLGGTSVLSKQRDEAFSPRMGLLYKPAENVSLYTSYTRAFNPNSGFMAAGGMILPPSVGSQYEVGAKARFDERLTATLAFYDIAKTNVPVTDLADELFYVASGEQRSRGVEVDVLGDLGRGWNLIASFALTDAYVSRDTTLSVGDKLVGVPGTSGSLWLSHTVQDGSLQGLGFGAGLFYVGNREAALPNTIEIPSYLRTDASVFYRIGAWDLALNVKNVFDTKYFDSQGFFLYPGPPTSVYGSLSHRF